MTNINLDRASLLTELKKTAVVVTFEKKNGEMRTMNCTRNLELAPHAPRPKEATPYDDNEDIIRVYDLNAEGWRSFIVDNVKSATILS